MRHGKSLRKFGRNWSHRRAMIRNLATSFFQYGRFETTVEKAKELRPVVEKLITLGKTDSLPARRQAYGYLLSKPVVHKLFTDIGPRCKDRNGGYTRIVRTRVRPGDAAEMAIIELVDDKAAAAPAKKKAKATKKVAAKSGARTTKKTAEKSAEATT